MLPARTSGDCVNPVTRIEPSGGTWTDTLGGTGGGEGGGSCW